MKRRSGKCSATRFMNLYTGGQYPSVRPMLRAMSNIQGHFLSDINAWCVHGRIKLIPNSHGSDKPDALQGETNSMGGWLLLSGDHGNVIAEETPAKEPERQFLPGDTRQFRDGPLIRISKNRVRETGFLADAEQIES